jgi:hypothetical protein
VLADARQEFDRYVLRGLLGCLGDPDVGCVSGELVLTPHDASDAAAEGATVYWSYEKLIRWSESRVDSTVGATGAIYAIRRRLFESLPDDTILDDVLIPVRIARQGFRVMFEPAARAFDGGVYDARGEFMRKARTMAGNMQLFARERWLLSPTANRLWLQTVSHKALRLMLPALYLTLLVANVPLAGDGLFRWLMIAQVIFYGAAALGCVSPRLGKIAPLLVVPYEICFLNLAVMVGLVNYIANRQRVTWDRPSAIATS